MLIKYKDEVINLDNVLRFYKCKEDSCIRVDFQDGWSYLYFETDQERNQAFTDITTYYLVGKNVCDLE